MLIRMADMGLLAGYPRYDLAVFGFETPGLWFDRRIITSESSLYYELPYTLPMLCCSTPKVTKLLELLMTAELPINMCTLDMCVCITVTYHIPSTKTSWNGHDDVTKWKQFPRYWPFVRGIHRSPVNSRTKASDAGLWCFLWSGPG